MTAFRILPVLAIAAISGGCFMGKQPTVAIPVATSPVPASAPAPSSNGASSATPAQPTAPAAPQAVAPSTPVPAPTQPAKPSPFPPTSPPAASAPKPAPVSPTPAPALGAILTADRRKSLDAAYQSDVRQANAVLTGLNGRSLTPAQTDSVNRARAFIRQAAQYHDRDLTTAAELAHRARVLTQELAGALK